LKNSRTQQGPSGHISRDLLNTPPKKFYIYPYKNVQPPPPFPVDMELKMLQQAEDICLVVTNG